MTTDYGNVAVGASLTIYYLIAFALAVFSIVCLWRIFSKAGEPGWGAIVPFYNMYLLFKITFGNGWLFLLTLIPVVNFIMLIIAYVKLAQNFGKGGGFAVGLIFLSPIFLGILAFDDSTYTGIQK